MGGNAFATKYEVKRMTREQYLKLITKYGLENKVVKSFKDKQDYGDIDVICNGPEEKYNILLRLKNKYGLTTVDTSCGSHLFKDDEVGYFQVDFILPGDAPVEYTRFYYNYKLGIILGMVVAKYGYRLKDDGLYKRTWLRNGTRRDIFITNDVETVLNYLGLPYPVPEFEDEYASYDYVASSDYFCPSIISVSELSFKTAKRIREMDFFGRFKAYLEERKSTIKYNRRTNLDKVDKGLWYHEYKRWVVEDKSRRYINNRVKFHKVDAIHRRLLNKLDIFKDNGVELSPERLGRIIDRAKVYLRQLEGYSDHRGRKVKGRNITKSQLNDYLTSCILSELGHKYGVVMEGNHKQ
nr:MAG TPA: Repair DNA polymerase X/DNA Complex, DNA enzyme, Pb, TRANSFERASE-DNA [Caudoviricetes sp.]